MRVEAESAHLTPDYVRMHAIDALGKSFSGPGSHVFVLPTGKDGLPGYFLPFLKPFSKMLDGQSP